MAEEKTQEDAIPQSIMDKLSELKCEYRFFKPTDQAEWNEWKNEYHRMASQSTTMIKTTTGSNELYDPIEYDWDSRYYYLYIVSNDMIVGYCRAVDDIDKNSKKFYHIKYVTSRKRGVCQLMVRLLIVLTNKNNYDYYYLSNVAGRAGCTCYQKAFRERGYHAYKRPLANKLVEIQFHTFETCWHSGPMYFLKPPSGGGKRTRNTKKRHLSRRKSLRNKIEIK
jgi:hypothetical protein